MKTKLYPRPTRIPTRSWLICWATLLLTFLSPRAHAQQAGRIDPSFGASLGLANKVRGALVQPDGRLLVFGEFRRGIARLNADGTVSSGFTPGVADDVLVPAAALQPDGKIIIVAGGSGATTLHGLARLNADGSLDASFNPGSGGNSLVASVAVQSDGKVIVGGYFTTFNGVSHYHVARLNPGGGLDSSFTASTGLVRTVKVQPDDKILLGGDIPVTRLNANGSMDTSFDSGNNATSNVNSLTVLPDGKILVAGSLSENNGGTRNGVLRLSPTGALDTGFNTPIGNNDTIYAAAAQPNGSVTVSGYFNNLLGAYTAGVVHLRADGSMDPGINAASGITDGTVDTLLAQSDNKVIFSGKFTVINGTPRNGIGRLNVDGTPDGGFQADLAPGPNLAANTVALQPDGKVLIGGSFTTFSGQKRNRIARLSADGTLDTSFDPGAGFYGGGAESVNALTLQPDGKIIAGGRYTTINGSARNGLARLNVGGDLDSTFLADSASGPGLYVSAVARQADGKIIRGGGVSFYNGTPPRNIARVTASGSLDAGFNVSTGQPSNYINAVAVQPDNNVLIGGGFTTINGSSRVCLARLQPDGTLDPGFFAGSGASYYVAAIVLQADGRILVGGDFGSVNGTPLGRVARLNANGQVDSSFTPGASGANGIVTSMAVQPDGKIVLGGQFTSFNGASFNHVLRLTSAGALDPGFNPGTGANGDVNALVVQPDGKILVVGNFNVFNGAVRNYAARLNADGSLDPTFNPGVGVPSVLDLKLQPADGQVVVGGAFTSAGGQPANGLARLRTDGSRDPSFNAPFSPGDSVQALQRQSDGAVVASALVADNSTGSGANPFAARSKSRRSEPPPAEGNRHPIQPHAESKLKNPIKQCSPINGSFEATFNPDAGTSGVAYCLSLQPGDGKIVVGGNFALLNGTAGHPNLGRLDANGYLDAAFTPTTDDTVQAVLAQADGRIVLGGIFTQVNGAARGRLARLLADGTLDPGFNAFAGTDGPVAALKLQGDGRLVVAGTFASANGSPRANLARLNADGTLDMNFGPTVALTASAAGTVLVSSVDQQADGKLIIAGLFDRVNGVTRNKVARLFPDGTLDTAYDPGAGPDAVVRAIALQPDGKTLLGGDFTTVDNTERNAAARLLGDYDLNAYPALGQWRILNFGNPNNAGVAADTAAPFGDGVVNLLKFALNLNAQAADATPMLPAGSRGLPLVARDANGRLTMTFVRRQSGTTPGITYSVEFADGLNGAFAMNPAASVSQPVAIDATWERVTVTDSVPMGAQTRRFVRLRVTEGSGSTGSLAVPVDATRNASTVEAPAAGAPQRPVAVPDRPREGER